MTNYQFTRYYLSCIPTISCFAQYQSSSACLGQHPGMDSNYNVINKIYKLSLIYLFLGKGPCASSLDDTLKQCGVERQAYHGKSFIGNHCHTMLKVLNHYN